MQHRLKTELFSVTMRRIYTTIGVCDRETTERERERERERDQRKRDQRKREKTGIKSVRSEDCFSSLTGVNGSKERTQQATNIAHPNNITYTQQL